MTSRLHREGRVFESLWAHFFNMADLPITREEALELLQVMPQQASDMNHYLETEAIMKSLAEKFGENAEYWGMIGLLHDIDWALTRNNRDEHCIKAAEI